MISGGATRGGVSGVLHGVVNVPYTGGAAGLNVSAADGVTSVKSLSTSNNKVLATNSKSSAVTQQSRGGVIERNVISARKGKEKQSGVVYDRRNTRSNAN